MKGRVIYLLTVLVMGFTGSAMGEGPVAVSPGGEGSLALIGQECPTFSWSQVDGAVSYRLKVFERVNGEILSYGEMERTRDPVMSVEISAPALSWTPSAGECFGTGKKYVWYVGALSSLSPLSLRGGEEGLRQWSNGKAFEVEIGVSAGMREAVKETVKEYLTKEWILTESYQQVKESITSQIAREVKGVGGVAATQNVVPLGTEGTYNTLYGTGAGANLGDDDDYATFIGYQAGYSTIEGANPGDGKDNTFVGYKAGYANTTGGRNSFLGTYAGTSNTTGYANTFLGGYNGSQNTTCYNNTFLGEATGNYNTIGYSNTFLGNGAGNNNTTGYQNTFMGNLAGVSNSFGYSNTFLGHYTGFSNTTGYSNTFVGINAGYSNSDGNSNTLLGRGAGYWNTSGSGNVFLGYSAGSNETGSNKLYIDNSETPTPLIYGEFDNNLVKIHGTLQVASAITPSDERLKRDIQLLERSLEKLTRLQGVHYSWRTEEYPGRGLKEGTQVGLIAQEVEKVFPELVHTGSDGYKAIDYQKLVPLLIEALKEQGQKYEAVLQAQQADINELKALVMSLHKR